MEIGNKKIVLSKIENRKLSFSSRTINIMTSWDLLAMNCQISFNPLILPLGWLHFSSFLPPNFSASLYPLSHFPLSASSHISSTLHS